MTVAEIKQKVREAREAWERSNSDDDLRKWDLAKQALAAALKGSAAESMRRDPYGTIKPRTRGRDIALPKEAESVCSILVKELRIPYGDVATAWLKVHDPNKSLAWNREKTRGEALKVQPVAVGDAVRPVAAIRKAISVQEEVVAKERAAYKSGKSFNDQATWAAIQKLDALNDELRHAIAVTPGINDADNRHPMDFTYLNKVVRNKKTGAKGKVYNTQVGSLSDPKFYVTVDGKTETWREADVELVSRSSQTHHAARKGAKDYIGTPSPFAEGQAIRRHIERMDREALIAECEHYNLRVGPGLSDAEMRKRLMRYEGVY